MGISNKTAHEITHNDDKHDLLLDGNRGIYLPQHFAESLLHSDLYIRWNVSLANYKILLAGPNHEHYWDAWAHVLDNARFRDDAGFDWYLYQDGDLFVYRADYEFPVLDALSPLDNY